MNQEKKYNVAFLWAQEYPLFQGEERFCINYINWLAAEVCHLEYLPDIVDSESGELISYQLH